MEANESASVASAHELKYHSLIKLHTIQQRQMLNSYRSQNVVSAQFNSIFLTGERHVAMATPRMQTLGNFIEGQMCAENRSRERSSISWVNRTVRTKLVLPLKDK